MTRRSTRTAVFAAATVASSASFSRAEHASVRLSYAGAEAATSCPDEATFRGLVAARIGYDPFTGDGNPTLAVTFERRGGELKGRLQLSADPGEKQTERTLRSSPEECFELATSLALVAAVAVDPDASTESAEPPSALPTQESPPTEAPPATEPVPPPADAAPPRERTRPVAASAASETSLRLELGGLLVVGMLPALGPGVRAGAGLDFGVWSLSAEGEFLFPSARENPQGEGEVSALVVAGSLVPCADPFGAQSFGLELCAVGSLGAQRSTARQVTRAEPTTDLFATVGPRVAAVARLSRFLGVGVSAEAPVVLSRVRLFIEEGGERRQVWAAPPVGLIGAVSLIASIP